MNERKYLTRRDCLIAASAVAVVGRQALARGATTPPIAVTPDPARPAVPASLRVVGEGYVWSWTAKDDVFHIKDRGGREIASSELQPTVVAQVAGATKAPRGHLKAVEIGRDRATFVYEREDLQADVTVEVGFASDRFWYEPVRIEGRAAADVVELRWFGVFDGGQMVPLLSNKVVVVPGVDMSPTLSPVLFGDVGVNMTVSLGYTQSPVAQFQEWGLPVHYFCGYNLDERDPWEIDARSVVPDRLSAAFCCGLASLPAADLLLQTSGGQHSLIFRYNSELWGQARLPGSLSVGARVLFTFGATYQDAIRGYYRAMRESGEIPVERPSAAKRALMTSSIYSIWGGQVAADSWDKKFTQAALEDLYDAFRASGLRMDVFEIDEGWDTHDGTLTHSETRLPHFEAFLERVRADGMKYGLWIVPLRCTSPQEIGLELRHLLKLHDGTPAKGGSAPDPYFFLDVTQPEVEANVRERLQRMMKRYRPSLLKFDFGYEMPPLSLGAPADMRFAGEKLLIKTMDLLVDAVREIDPDVVVMYYGLSPFMRGRMDIHSPDDLYAAWGDFDIEANRRFYFSSLMGELGVPTYGSGGYDWASMPSIWFDSAMIGSLGVLADCRGDIRGAKPTRDMVALFNGLRETVRHTTEFSIETSPVDPLSPTRGAHAPSWIRRERGEVVGVALRHDEWMGSPGTSRVPGVIETEVSVIAASQTDEPLTRASSVAIVPLGTGEIRLSRTGRLRRAELVHHYADGSSHSEWIAVKDRHLKLRPKTRGPNDVPLEWCEVRFRTGVGSEG